MLALEHHSAGDTDAGLGLCAWLKLAVFGADLAQGVGAIETVWVRIVSVGSNVVELGEALSLLGLESATTEQVGFGIGGGVGCFVHRG